MPLSDQILNSLHKALPGQVRTDLVTKILFSTDASIYQIEPLGVVVPHTADDLAAAVEIAATYGIPVLPRGSGSSLAGQAIGPALILDCSRYLNRILDINPEEGTATVEPGVILNALNRQAERFGLQFGPDPASAERATLGGSIANNATGAHSIVYGMAADHLLEADVILADGSVVTLGEVSLEKAERMAGGSREGEQSIISRIYKTALNIRQNYAESIRQHWPKTWRCASGYAINYLLPWTATQPPQWGNGMLRHSNGVPYPLISPGKINLAVLLAGSEGTLAIIRKAKIRLVTKPKHTMLGVMPFKSLAEACDAVPAILEHQPSAVELIPQELIGLARSVPAYCHLVSFVDQLEGASGSLPALLVVEFAGDNPASLRNQARRLGTGVLLAETVEMQKQVWAVRKVGLGILMSRPGDLKPVAFIEDLSVPVTHLGTFVREMQRILTDHGTVGDIYAHASAGCLHIRPMLNLKSVQGVAALRSIASQAVELTLSLGGAVSGEHGDGLARSEWLKRAFGEDILAAFQELKQAADPKGILNPGKIIQPELMDTHLRYGNGYQARAWQPIFDYSIREEPRVTPDTQGELLGATGLAAAIEHCNGAGVCRKSEGVMCPSFQATQEEMHSTRGRANLLRAMISGAFPVEKLAEKAVKEALDLCLACKGCKAECPSGVDMAKLKYEFTQHYYSTHRRRLRDYLFGYIDKVARLAAPLAPVANLVLSSRWFTQLGERFFGLTSKRPFPRFAVRSLQKTIKDLKLQEAREQEPVFFLNDAFTEFFHPQAGISAIRVLQACGYRVHILPMLGAGRTLISKGFLQAAKRHAAYVLEIISRLDPEGSIPIVGLEPSEIYTLRDEYLDLFPGDSIHQQLARKAAQRAWMIDEFLIRPGQDGRPRMALLFPFDQTGLEKGRQVLLHGHCYQKAQPPAADGSPTGVAATVRMLQNAGMEVRVIDSTCCGMAGAFGYEAEHYDISIQVGELDLFPAIRQAGEGVVIAASGVSCQAQITDGTKRSVVHPIVLIEEFMRPAV